MSFLTRFIRSLRPNRLVGRDLDGNRFYEHPSSSDDSRRTKRTVQYRDPEDVWKYIGGGKRLAVQWSSWLSHTRSNPPTLEELQADMARQQRVLANVALIEARDREERAQLLLLEATPANSTSNHPPEPLTTTEEKQRPPSGSEEPHRQKAQATAEASPVSSPKPASSSPLPKMPGSDTYEPESWTPRARTRGQ